MSFGTSLAEAYMPEEQIDPRQIFEISNEYDGSGSYDPQEANKSSYYKGGSTVLPKISDTQSVGQVQGQMQQVQQVQQVQQMQTPQVQTESCPADQIQNQNSMSNPVREYPPYEYDQNALQQQLQQTSLQHRLDQVQHIKNIKQNRKKLETFTDENTNTNKKM